LVSTKSLKEEQMGDMRKKVVTKASSVAGKTAARVKTTVAAVETQLLADEGRRSVRAKTATVTKVTKKALKAGVVTGAAAMAAVIVHEVRKRRAL
jgi:hypothetical protein